MRKPHVLGSPKTTSGYPSRIITFDVETRPDTCGDDGDDCPTCKRIAAGAMLPDDEVSTLILGCALDWTGDKITYTDADTFWDWVDDRCIASEPTMLINHNIGYDLMVLGWDAAMTERGWKAEKIIIPEPSGPFAVTWKRTDDGATLRMLNLANWWGMRPLATIGAIVGAPKGTIDPTAPRYRHARVDTDPWRELELYCAQDCQVVADAYAMWVRFCQDHDLGPFAITQAGQALAAFRHRFSRHEITVHTQARAIALERAAYLGGRTEVFRMGRISGDVHVVDVNSLYPYVMAEHRYPSKLRGVVGALSREELVGLIDAGYGVIARVDVDTAVPVVPTRHEGRLVYPIGQFETALCTPEVATAIDAGVINNIKEVAIYDMAPLFKDYVTELYALRREYHSQKNMVWYEIVKVFLNSLYGKFGQANFEWHDTHEEMALRLPAGTHTIVDAQTGERITIRTLGGTCQRKSDQRVEGHHSFVAVAAHVTAHARTHISNLRHVARPGNVYYCDTDSLFVNDAGLQALSGYVDAERLGALKLETTASGVTINGLKDYEIGKKKKLKGIRRDAVAVGDGSYRQTQFRGIAGALRAGEPGVARVGQVTKRPTGKYHKGQVGGDGWVQPIVLA